MFRIFIILLLLPSLSFAKDNNTPLEKAKEIYFGLKKIGFPSNDSVKSLLIEAYELTSKESSDSGRYYNTLILTEKSIVEYRQSNYQQAIADGLKALSMAKSLGNKILLHKISYHLGGCYIKIGSGISDLESTDKRATHIAKSKSYLNESLAVARDLNDSTLIIQSIAGIASAYVGQQEYDSATFYCNQIIDNAAPGNHKSLSMAYNYLGIIEYEKKDFKKSGEYFAKTIVEAKQVPGSLTLLSAMGNLANVYMEQKNYELARNELYKLIALNLAANRKQALSKNYITLHNVFKRQKIYDSALFYSDKYYLYKDSILNETQKAALQELEVKYETAKKEKEINSLLLTNSIREADLRKKNVWMILISSIAFLITAVAFFLYRQRNLKQKQATAEMKQQLLSAQMNPHFLFNALNSIQRLYVDGKIEEGNEFMSNFAQFVRDILDKTGRSKIPLYEEVEFLDAYLNLEKKRLGDKFDYRITMSEELKNSFFEVPSLISQPLAENALLHGILPQNEKGFIDIEVKQENIELIIFTIKDNGIGYDTSLRRKNVSGHISKGTELIRSRLGKNGKLIIKSILSDFKNEHGTIATIEVPV